MNCGLFALFSETECTLKLLSGSAFQLTIEEPTASHTRRGDSVLVENVQCTVEAVSSGDGCIVPMTLLSSRANSNIYIYIRVFLLFVHNSY